MKWLYKTSFSNKISRFFGKISFCSVPIFLRHWLWSKLAKKLKINLEEVALPLQAYPTFNAFFTRELKPGVRVIHPDKCTAVSPVDGTVLKFGQLQKGELIQAKNINYSLKEFCPVPGYSQFENAFFLTLYLAPFDCHRIFSPLNAKIILTAHVPGRLFPVREPYISGMPNLYIQNERVITVLQHPDLGLIAMVYVGAFNVGSIGLTYLPNFKTNLSTSCLSLEAHSTAYPIQKGEHLATFYIGSTVVLLVENHSKLKKINLSENQSIKYGDPIFSF